MIQYGLAVLGVIGLIFLAWIIWAIVCIYKKQREDEKQALYQALLDYEDRRR